MARPTKLPEWASDGAQITEPTSGQKATGWNGGQAPGSEVQNWYQENVYRWIEFLQDAPRKHELSLISQWVDMRVGVFGDWESVAAGPTQLVAVGESGLISRKLQDSYAWATATPAAAYADTFFDVCYFSLVGKFVICGEDDQIQSSSDSTTWTSISGTGDDFYCCAAGASFAACGGENGTLKTTSNGISATARTSAHGSIPIFDMCYSPTLNKILAVGGGGTYQLSNSTGSSWTSSGGSVAIGSNNILECVWSETQQLFFCITDSAAFSSPDGITWSAATGNITFLDGTAAAHVTALPEHLAVFSSGSPAMVRMFRYEELDGTPASVTELSLIDAIANTAEIIRCVRFIPVGQAFGGRLAIVGHDGFSRLSHYFGGEA